jgi:hypothetical protein
MKTAMTSDRTMMGLSRGKVRFPTTLSYSPVHDHKRLPGRFHARFVCAGGGLA